VAVAAALVEPTPIGELLLITAVAGGGAVAADAYLSEEDDGEEFDESWPNVKGTNRDKGDTYRPKTKGANAADRKRVDDIARGAGIDRDGFGKYVEDRKSDVSRGGSDNYSYDQLKRLADEYKQSGDY